MHAIETQETLKAAIMDKVGTERGERHEAGDATGGVCWLCRALVYRLIKPLLTSPSSMLFLFPPALRFHGGCISLMTYLPRRALTL